VLVILPNRLHATVDKLSKNQALPELRPSLPIVAVLKAEMNRQSEAAHSLWVLCESAKFLVALCKASKRVLIYIIYILFIDVLVV
jgi:hypothetical protein